MDSLMPKYYSLPYGKYCKQQYISLYVSFLSLSFSLFVMLNPTNVSMPGAGIWSVITLDKQIFSGPYNFTWNKALAALGNSDIRLTRYVNTWNVIIAHWQTTAYIGGNSRVRTGRSWKSSEILTWNHEANWLVAIWRNVRWNWRIIESYGVVDVARIINDIIKDLRTRDIWLRSIILLSQKFKTVP